MGAVRLPRILVLTIDDFVSAQKQLRALCLNATSAGFDVQSESLQENLQDKAESLARPEQTPRPALCDALS